MTRNSSILSYNSAPQIEALYRNAIQDGTNGAKKHDVELIYSTGIMLGRKPSKEIVISNINQLPAQTKFWKTAAGIQKESRLVCSIKSIKF